MENVFLLSYQGTASSIILSGVKFDDRHKTALIPEEKLSYFISADGSVMFKDVKIFQINPTDASKMIEIKNISQVKDFNEKRHEEVSLEEESQVEEKVEETLTITVEEINSMKVDELREVVAKFDPEFDVKGLSKTELKEKLMSYAVEE